jgi:hypothetical protein
VKAHQVVHLANRGEGFIDRAVQLRFLSALGRDFDKRAEERAGSPHLT